MKKALFCAGSLVVALGVVIGAGRLFADGEKKKPAKDASPLARIALVNLTYVIKNYDKYKDFQVKITHDFEPFRERDKELRAQLDELRVQSETPAVGPAKKKKLEEKAKKVQQEMEDNSAEAKKVAGQKNDEEMLILYKDVYEEAQRYAVAHGIELVLHHNDAPNEADYWSPQNLARKLTTGALIPLYAAPGMDISEELTKTLNENVRKK